jgi:hypothetical protein
MFDGREASRRRHRTRQDVQDSSFLQNHLVVVRPNLGGHGLDENLSPVGQLQAHSRPG